MKLFSWQRILTVLWVLSLSLTPFTAEAEPAAEVAANNIASEVALDPARFTANLAGVRLDIAAVLQAICYRLQGQQTADMGPVHFAAEVAPFAVADDTLLADFTLRSVSIRRDEGAKGAPLHRRLEALLQLTDVYERQAFFTVVIDYLLGDGTILVRQAVAIPAPSTATELRLLVVPANRLPSLQILQLLPFTELYRLAVENALSAEELQLLTPSAQGQAKLVAFNLVRGPAEERLRIGAPASTDQALALNLHGWTVAVAEGELAALVAPEARLTLARFHTDRPQAPEILGDFSIAGHR